MVQPLADTVVASARDDHHSTCAPLIRALARARAGEVTGALTELDRVRRDSGPMLGDHDGAALLGTAVDCHLARGELLEAAALGDHLARYLELGGMPGATAHFGRGELSAAHGDADLAAAHFTRAGRLVAGDLDDPDRLPWRTAAALAAVRLGHRAEATTLVREHLALAHAAGTPYAVAVGLRTLATVTTRGDRIDLLREARAALGDVPAARLAAQIDTDLAGLLLLTGGAEAVEEAHGRLRRAEEYAGREHLRPLHARIRRLLERMGERPRPAPEEVLALLTAAERRVALLAAEGRTNREVADQLEVTVKAVEWHLSPIYRKLGIRARAELGRSLGLGS